jgi:F-type H+-transporting ATPase subunit b
MLLQLNPGLMIWTIVTFLALVIVLRLFAWKPILALLEAREKKIRDDLETAASNREAAEKALADIKRQLDIARKEANEIVSQARSAAETVREETLTKAKGEYEQMLTKAKSEIQLERDKAAQSLREEFAELAVSAAGQIIGQTLKPQDHINIIRKTIGEIK